jgi:hypothetical protein
MHSYLVLDSMLYKSKVHSLLRSAPLYALYYKLLIHLPAELFPVLDFKIKVLRISVYKYLCGHKISFILGKYIGVE